MTHDVAGPSVASDGSRWQALALVAVALVGSAVGGVLFAAFSTRPYELTADDINLLKDAAAVLGPGDPIARSIWRLAERAEGK
jgi:hypothetical protein